ncbi:MAG: hypothetical protein ACM3ML_28270 [Micromonosporaceae bacterium]
MRYAVLIYERPGSYEPLGDDERKAVSAEYLAIRDDPRVVARARRARPVRGAGGDRVVAERAGH